MFIIFQNFDQKPLLEQSFVFPRVRLLVFQSCFRPLYLLVLFCLSCVPDLGCEGQVTPDDLCYLLRQQLSTTNIRIFKHGPWEQQTMIITWSLGWRWLDRPRMGLFSPLTSSTASFTSGWEKQSPKSVLHSGRTMFPLCPQGAAQRNNYSRWYGCCSCGKCQHWVKRPKWGLGFETKARTKLIAAPHPLQIHVDSDGTNKDQ